MNWSTELPFILDGVDGDLKLVYSPMGQKFYQNGREIKKTGSGLGGLKYKVETTDGGDDIIKIKAALKPGRQVVFRGETINLESPLGGLVMLLSFLPFVFILFVIMIISKGRFGIIDGALLGGCGALGMLAIGNILRGEKDFIKQLIYSIIISIAATVIFIILALIIGLIMGIMFGVAFSFF